MKNKTTKKATKTKKKQSQQHNFELKSTLKISFLSTILRGRHGVPVPGQTAWVGDRLLNAAALTDGSGWVSVNSFALFSASLEGINAALFFFFKAFEIFMDCHLDEKSRVTVPYHDGSIFHPSDYYQWKQRAWHDVLVIPFDPLLKNCFQSCCSLRCLFSPFQAF